ncbi:hypothetical protein [Streptomyces sp. NPDC059994]|uniref:hypothetical protein n=1 Tax=Streptomyces sp. NPDC059994 TaxID=3347029 RepID=UPI0036B2510E
MIYEATHRINPLVAAFRLLGIYSADLEEWELDTEQDEEFVAALANYLDVAYESGFTVGVKNVTRLHRMGVVE